MLSSQRRPSRLAISVTTHRPALWNWRSPRLMQILGNRPGDLPVTRDEGEEEVTIGALHDECLDDVAGFDAEEGGGVHGSRRREQGGWCHIGLPGRTPYRGAGHVSLSSAGRTRGAAWHPKKRQWTAQSADHGGEEPWFSKIPGQTSGVHSAKVSASSRCSPGLFVTCRGRMTQARLFIGAASSVAPPSRERLIASHSGGNFDDNFRDAH